MASPPARPRISSGPEEPFKMSPLLVPTQGVLAVQFLVAAMATALAPRIRATATTVPNSTLRLIDNSSLSSVGLPEVSLRYQPSGGGRITQMSDVSRVAPGLVLPVDLDEQHPRLEQSREYGEDH